MTGVEPYNPGEPHGLTRVEYFEFQSTATRMRNWGYGWPQIASQLGIHPILAETLVVEHLMDITRESAEMMAARQAVVCNDIVKANYRGLANGDTAAATVVLKTLDHQAKLFGLYAPSRYRVSLDDQDFAADTARLLDELGYVKDETKVIDAAPDDGEPWSNI